MEAYRLSGPLMQSVSGQMRGRTASSHIGNGFVEWKTGKTLPLASHRLAQWASRKKQQEISFLE